jgi:hypothetical protein
MPRSTITFRRSALQDRNTYKETRAAALAECVGFSLPD